jgi:hypothetical protein
LQSAGEAILALKNKRHSSKTLTKFDMMSPSGSSSSKLQHCPGSQLLHAERCMQGRSGPQAGACRTLDRQHLKLRYKGQLASFVSETKNPVCTPPHSSHSGSRGVFSSSETRRFSGSSQFLGQVLPPADRVKRRKWAMQDLAPASGTKLGAAKAAASGSKDDNILLVGATGGTGG